MTIEERYKNAPLAKLYLLWYFGGWQDWEFVAYFNRRVRGDLTDRPTVW